MKRDWKCIVFLISFLLIPQIVFAPMGAVVEEIRTEPVSRGDKYVIAEITAYSEHYNSTGKHIDHPAYGITSSGEKVRQGIVAADTSVFPMHSILYIEGVGKVEVKDVGGAIKGYKLDLYFPTEKQAIEWGRQKRKVHVIRIGGEK